MFHNFLKIRPQPATYLIFSILYFTENGRASVSQNHLTSSVSALFTTRNNTRIIAQRGGLAILPCAVKWNPSATVRIYFLFLQSINYTSTFYCVVKFICG